MQNEFSTRSMKNLINEQTDKRISEPVCNELGRVLHDHAEGRAADANSTAQNRHRKTVREQDFVDTAGLSYKSYEFSIPNAPVERIIRNAGAERVSKGAVVRLKDEVVSLGMKYAQEMVRLADHAERDTIKVEDLNLARKEISH